MHIATPSTYWWYLPTVQQVVRGSPFGDNALPLMWSSNKEMVKELNWVKYFHVLKRDYATPDPPQPVYCLTVGWPSGSPLESNHLSGARAVYTEGKYFQSGVNLQ